MRRSDEIGPLADEPTVVLSCWLLGKDIHSSTTNSVLRQCLQQSDLINNTTSRHVDQNGIVTHQLKFPKGNHVGRI